MLWLGRTCHICSALESLDLFCYLILLSPKFSFFSSSGSHLLLSLSYLNFLFCLNQSNKTSLSSDELISLTVSGFAVYPLKVFFRARFKSWLSPPYIISLLRRQLFSILQILSTCTQPISFCSLTSSLECAGCKAVYNIQSILSNSKSYIFTIFLITTFVWPPS